jgi:hypothetical protein
VAKRKPKQSDIDAARIQRAVTGILIPMTSIIRVYAHAEKLIGEGADDIALANGIRAFVADNTNLHVGRR